MSVVAGSGLTLRCRRTVIVVLVAVTALFVGAPMAGATTTAATQYGFSFSLPKRWTQIPLTRSDVGVLLKEASKLNPTFANILDAQVEQAAKQGLKVFAVGPAARGFLPSLSVAVKARAGVLSDPASFRLAELQLKIVLRVAGLQDPHIAEVHLPVGTAIQVTYALPLHGMPHPAHGRQLYFAHAARLYVLTCTAATSSQAEAVARYMEVHWRWR
ncbi:MAG: hypothetical protein ACYCST_00140 [Acidimicrobiales bacterium]